MALATTTQTIPVEQAIAALHLIQAALQQYSQHLEAELEGEILFWTEDILLPFLHAHRSSMPAPVQEALTKIEALQTQRDAVHALLTREERA